MARAMRAISDIRPNWLFDASLMMGTTCPRIALMYSISVAPLDQGVPSWRHARATNTTTIACCPHAWASDVSPDAGRMAGYRTGRDQSAGCRTSPDGV